MDDTDAADAFGALAEETRLAILRALALAERPLRFSELRERVGVSDAGRFNYHLSTLAGRFIERREGRYALAEDGRRRVTADEGTDGPNSASSWPVTGESGAALTGSPSRPTEVQGLSTGNGWKGV